MDMDFGDSFQLVKKSCTTAQNKNQDYVQI